MPSPSYIHKLRTRLRACILERDIGGLTDELAAQINDLECRIRWAESAYAVRIVTPWFPRLFGWGLWGRVVACR